jgi:hypothetical protein
LKLKYDKLRSTVTFKFNLRRYAEDEDEGLDTSHHGRVVQLDPIKPTLKVLGTQRLRLKSEEPLSKLAFKFNLRRYTTAAVLITLLTKSSCNRPSECQWSGWFEPGLFIPFRAGEVVECSAAQCTRHQWRNETM